MSQRFKIGLIAGFLITLCVFVAVNMAISADHTPDAPGPGERVIMDELSLWNNPSNSGISYDRFEPLRVRRDGAEYFPRADVAGKHFAAFGTRYGEIRLTDDNGGLMYLPRYLQYDKDDAIKISLRQSNAKANWQIAVYPTADKIARVNATTPGITVVHMGDWLDVTIPLSDLKFEDYKTEIADPKDWRDPAALLAQYKLPKGYLYGIEFSLEGGKAKDSLFIDHLSLVKKSHTTPNKLTGQIKPFWGARGAEILLRSDKGDTTAKIAWTGAFSIDIPQDAKIIEVVAQTAGKVMSPRTGRFLEVGTYMPKLMIPANDPVVRHAATKGNQNTSIYIYEDKFGPRIEPDHNFLVQVRMNDKMVTSAELTTNSFGYIDRDRMAANPDKAYRVMVLGDCHHMGVHISIGDDWWNEAEGVTTMLTQRPVEFINASFNHASWTSSWAAFRDLGAEVNPDIVLLPMIDPGVLNLTVEEYMMDWLGAAKDHRPAYQFELTSVGKLIHKPNDPDWQLYQTPIPDADHKRIREQYTSLAYVHADPKQIPQWVNDNIKLSVETLKEFGKLAKQRHSRFAVLYNSNYGSSNKDKVVDNGMTYDPNLFPALMRKMAADAGVEFIDVSNDLHMSMNGADAPRIVFADNGHFTPYAHYRYGQALGNLVSSWLNAR